MIHDINENLPHQVREVICVWCRARWIAVYPVGTLLKELECRKCRCQGYVIATGESIQ